MHFRSDLFPIIAEAKPFPQNFPVLHMTYVQCCQPQTNLHYHNCLELGFVVQGNGSEMINNHIYSFDPDSVTVIQKGCIHDSHIFRPGNNDIESTWKFIFVDLEALGLSCENFGGFLTKDPELVHLFHYMYHELEQQKGSYQEMFKNLLSAFLIYADRIAPHTAPIISDELPPEMSYLIQRIHTSYNQELSVEQLARECNMSISTFCRTFKQYFGIPPLSYLINIRLAIAQNLLQTTDLSVLEIAQEAGFNSLSSLNRLFKKAFGISPRTMRKEYKSS